MLKNFDEIQKISKDNMDIAMKSFGAVSKGVQAIAVEVADYSKKSFEEGSAAAEKLFGAKSLEKAIEIQTDYAKTAYEGFVAGATRIGELYADLTKESYKPFEGFLGKVNGVVCGKTVALQASSQVNGDIHHMSFAIEQGALFEGRSRRAASEADLNSVVDGKGTGQPVLG